MLESERKHIEKIGRAEFQRRLVLANMTVRADARFVGLDKVCSQIAFQAALAAAGYVTERPGLHLTKDCGPPVEEGMRAADDLFAKAVAAARG